MVKMRRSSSLLLLLLLLAGVSISHAAEQAECEVGADGTTCINEKDNEAKDNDCDDTHEKCHDWMDKGECDANPVYMLRNCRKSCNTCSVVDHDAMMALVDRRTELYEVGGDETLLETPYGIEQQVDSSLKHEIGQIVLNFTFYMEHLIFAKEEYAAVKKTCKNRHRMCAYWKHLGECEKNPVYMTKECAPTCETCHTLDFKNRCPVDESIPEALQPGDLNKMFDNIMTNEHYQQYEPHALSMPDPTDAQKTDEGILDGPWVVVLDKLLTDEECDRLIQLGADEGYKVSADVGRKKFDGSYDSSVNNGRTSHNAWCGDECMKDEATKRVNAKLENVTGIPEVNNEYLQLLRYEVGQFYQTHHDYIPHHTERQQGVRTLTVFLYLNDVEAGGGTEFPTLGITVMPKKGKAVIWPSVFDEDPNDKDVRTEHGALPVEKGIKYGANAWIHQRNFKETLERGCI
eukprot:CAMPEP_0119007782 /NCGR_PEP_ID=MMETSP1176-20130426/3245_1 /TAXON_ID=265551 /ORGANISM="Synedropsis recta cf, Strain CCMP1620" /LENGTH=459 /DNA_ID=CAMNT_0006959997 /DNA_START=21 /DNA_END=1400 /DNA_ORIENTATION=-